MRIIGGKHKGRKFAVAPGFRGRPTTDFGKEGLFNILNHRVYLQGATVLDLFSGAGGISLEFASRGASQITSIERGGPGVKTLKSNYEILGYDSFQVIRGDALSFVKKAVGSYDIIFADPPYELPEMGKLPSMILTSGLLAEGGLVIVEHGEETDFSEVEGFEETRKYGHVNFSFFTLDE
ncbi:MAG: 16S rRNA (guanine(966)-N(2))-methyltransferase RsmD [Flavobacteriales bacterium]|nr:16S rRNA (guanine(966)-N(2))-methyltransferase RsmD [Flavobacteriales bacterium]MDG1780134.1 16S rRNA (guanine(966)-N(2))-methyltransferase RsmD [Flavobacteriales bacterium]MDG2247034.1 16S rRNA (guanine(966)-N(2))-methyltransferase RsmD [Flavobacteriales bacterium]